MATISRIFDLIANYLEKYPNQKVAFGYKRDGEWRKMSIQEYAEKIDYISYAFLKLGIQPGDKISIISTNRPEWNILDMAAQQIGAIVVPIYPTISQADYKYILNHAEVRLLFIEGKELRTRIQGILPEVKNIEHIYTFMDQGVYPYFQQLEDLGKENPNSEELQRRKDAVKPEDCATIIYTSGTTGLPKGVMLSHHNFVKQVEGVSGIPGPNVKRALSFLPLCHAYERMLVYLYQYKGYSIYYAESLGSIGDDIKHFKPNIMTCVPRFLEKIQGKLYSAGKKLPFLQRTLYFWAFNLAERYEIEGRSWWYNLKHTIANKLIYSKWRNAIGGDFDIVVSGGSAIQPVISRFFSGMGMPIFEGYGLSETSPVIAVSRKGKGNRKAGTVGVTLPGVEIRIEPENKEICCRGNNVMIGYYKAPELTKEVIDKDGWFHTGDTGVLENGLLRITGRLKTLFKNSGGKYINPQMIEEKCCESPVIENMVVVGENKKFTAAIISPDFVNLKQWCKMNHIQYTSNEDAINEKKVINKYKDELAKYSVNFGDWEKIKKFILVTDEWSQTDGFLTPTLKVKRNAVLDKYSEQVEKMFS